LFLLPHFHPFYFLFVGNDPFDGNYVSDELGESTFEELANWGKPSSYFGPYGNRRMAIQLLGQLDGTELHWKKHARRQNRHRRLMSFPIQPSPC
jgi:hypothetical protein